MPTLCWKLYVHYEFNLYLKICFTEYFLKVIYWAKAGKQRWIKYIPLHQGIYSLEGEAGEQQVIITGCNKCYARSLYKVILQAHLGGAPTRSLSQRMTNFSTGSQNRLVCGGILGTCPRRWHLPWLLKNQCRSVGITSWQEEGKTWGGCQRQGRVWQAQGHCWNTRGWGARPF